MTTVFTLSDGEARRPRGVDARDHVGVAAAAGEGLQPLRPKRIEAHRHPAKSRGRGARRLPGEQHSVGGERDVGDGLAAGHQRDQRGQVVPQKRLAAREPHLGDPEPAEDADQPVDLLEGEDRRAREPGVLGLGHAVAASQVAPVGHRHAEISERPAEHDPPGRRLDGAAIMTGAAARWRCVRRRRVGGIDPFHRAVLVELLLPDRHPTFHLLDHEAARLEGLLAMRAADCDGHRGVADLERPDPVLQRDAHRPPRLGLGHDAGALLLRHRAVSRVLQACDTPRPSWWSRTSPRNVATPPCAGSSTRRASAAGSIGLVVRNVGISRPPAVAGSPARPPRSAACRGRRGSDSPRRADAAESARRRAAIADGRGHPGPSP